MKLNLKSVVAGAAALALAGGLVISGAGAAQAATYDPDPYKAGDLSFYDASGAQIGGGNIADLPMATYYKASGGPTAGAGGFAYVTYATPQDGVPTASWTSNEQWTSAQDYTTLQASYPTGLKTPASNVVVNGLASDGSLADHIANFTSASALNPGVYQVRLYTSSGAPTYYAASVTVTGSTWTQTYPAIVSPATTTTLAPVASPVTVNAAATTLSASVTPSAGTITNGSVQFLDGATVLGTVAYTGTNPVTYTVPASGAGSFATGTHSLTAAYVPSGISFAGSTSAAQSLVVNGPVVTTSISSVTATSATGTSYNPAVLTANVLPVTAVGSVTFTDSIVGNLGSFPVVAGVATTSTTSLGLGSHVVTASFVPTISANFTASSGVAAALVLAGAATDAVPDPQTIQVIVAPGTLTISTPYNYTPATGTTPASGQYFPMGTMALSSDATYLESHAQFGNAANPANGVTITDTRSGDVAWTASAAAIDFTDATADTIDSHGFGFTAVTPRYIAGNALQPVVKPVLTQDVPSYQPAAALYATTGLKGAPHQFASAVHGVGTVYVTGQLDLYAPTSTKAGTYFTTLTFTAA